MKLIPILLIALCVQLQAGTIKITSTTLNVTAEFQGNLSVTSPTINVTVDGKTTLMTMKQFRSIQEVANTIIPSGPKALVTFDISIQK